GDFGFFGLVLVSHFLHTTFLLTPALARFDEVLPGFVFLKQKAHLFIVQISILCFCRLVDWRCRRLSSRRARNASRAWAASSLDGHSSRNVDCDSVATQSCTK